jgi:hypothetical protein
MDSVAGAEEKETISQTPSSRFSAFKISMGLIYIHLFSNQHEWVKKHTIKAKSGLRMSARDLCLERSSLSRKTWMEIIKIGFRAPGIHINLRLRANRAGD